MAALINQRRELVGDLVWSEERLTKPSTREGCRIGSPAAGGPTGTGF